MLWIHLSISILYRLVVEHWRELDESKVDIDSSLTPHQLWCQLSASVVHFVYSKGPSKGWKWKKGVWYLCPAWTVAIHHSWWLHFNSIETDRRFKQTEWDTKQRESSVSSIPFSLVYYIQNDNWQTLAAISARRSNAYPSHSKGKSTFDRSNAMSFLALLTFLISSE